MVEAPDLRDAFMRTEEDFLFDALVAQFENLPCWAVVARKGTVPPVSICFGAKPVDSPHLLERPPF
jgi:hypothetical protein